MTVLLAPLILAQATGPGGTPIWVILIIVFLILVLFLWGVTNSSGVRKRAEESAARDEPEGEDGAESDMVGTEEQPDTQTTS